MPELEDVAYSRDETVQAIRDYYDFLASMYMDPSRIIRPPEGGWPALTPSNLEGFNKSDEVVQLLRRLPYIAGDKPDPYLCRPHGAPGCKFHDYTDDALNHDLNGLRSMTEGGFMDQVPSHVFGLLSGTEDDSFLLDTELGIVHWIECPTEIKRKPQDLKTVLSHRSGLEGAATDNNNDDDDDRFGLIERVLDDFYDDDLVPEEEQEWRADAGTWAIADFFQLLKLQFLALTWIPLSSKRIIDVWTLERRGAGQMVVDLQRVWREHGWPPLPTDVETGRLFDKQGCLAQVLRLLQERYPDYAEFLDQYP
ncbi:hypothetical protein LIA77_05150 [Sarocladium implicatum]|nr:hypothetical protein LIA77_05150 [Sarocladium implicatum]